MLLDFTEETIVPTGVVEHTDLTDIDRAVARFFMGVVDSLVVTDAERPENDNERRLQLIRNDIKSIDWRVQITL